MVDALLDARRLREWPMTPALLREIIGYLLSVIPERHGPVPINSIHRTDEEEDAIERELSERLGRPYKTSRVHTLWRAADIDIDQSKLRDAEIQDILSQVNDRYQYDTDPRPERQRLRVAMYHLGHFHVQIHPRTAKRARG